ncbi:hypothetical protein J2Z21_003635 [Streptomyces griseochromogenes]|uniref:Uncharacterized protein n=1 Tax=Streptomyces griseochromogenes TaxID=68214 RepID=A0A1B1B7U9_9ACTN|nr:hypothetical protein [Streptomyces griseochromogenes]ANP54924.1 hypothetical protein AVL59_39810 [Streptomyces griseochromogenes]MBP2050696.1 hypothetical protein [Streptomyces griseochromogenes]
MEATPNGGGGAGSASSGGSGSGGQPDLRVEGLNSIAEGINKALSEMDSLGGMKGWAGAGRGFTSLEMTGMDVGDDHLGAVLHTFCERWQWGVRDLMREGNAFAEAMGLAAGTFHQTDEYVKGSMKIAYNSAVGDPFASNDKVEKESVDQINHASMTTGYGDKDRENLVNSVRRTGKGMLWDVATAEVPGDPISPSMMRDAAGMSDESYDAEVEKVLGPRPKGGDGN